MKYVAILGWWWWRWWLYAFFVFRRNKTVLFWVEDVSLHKSIITFLNIISSSFPLFLYFSLFSYCPNTIYHSSFFYWSTPSSWHCYPSPSPHLFQILFHSFFSSSLHSPLSLSWCIHSRICCGFFRTDQCFAWRVCFVLHFFLNWGVNGQRAVLAGIECFAVAIAAGS